MNDLLLHPNMYSYIYQLISTSHEVKTFRNEIHHKTCTFQVFTVKIYNIQFIHNM